ncbi:MAG: ATP-binding protein [Pararhodobacter sp.]
MPGALLKRFLPRGFYGRAALILLVPVTCILLIASYAVIQRHYEGMTRQMTGIFALTVAHVQAAVDAAPDTARADQQAARLGQAFDLQARVHPVGATPAQGTRASLLSLSDRMMLEQLHRGIPDVQVVTLDGNIVTLWLDSRHGPLSLRFRSNTVSPRNPHQLLVVVLLGGVLMSAIGFVFLKNQVRPILRLAAAAEAFGLGKTVPYRPSGAREVRAAGLAFVEMRDRIERHIEQRTLLLSGVSHDLRTPLTRMRLALSMMHDEGEAAAMLDDVAQMEALIDRLLDFARAEAGEAPVITDLTALVRQSLDRAARGGGQAVALAGAPGPLMVQLRPHLFGRALDNLIDNALRYGTRVEVRIRSGGAGPETGAKRPNDGQTIVVEVEDNGPGIPGDLRDAAMRPFVRLDKARSAARGATGQTMGGVGLGLAIAGDAMRSHGGHLELADGCQPGLGGLLARLVLPVKGA